MIFLHPWAIGLGVAVIGLPVLIHWLTRPRPVRLPLSTLRFVREIIEQRRAFHRLRNWVILALRILAVALLAWVFSRPLAGDRPAVSDEEPGAATRVVILDVSQSMAADVDGTSAFERARSIAAGYLSHRAGLKGDLILAGARPHAVFDRCSTNIAALREALDQAAPRPERLNLSATITMAAELLAQSPTDSAHRRELVVITDFQRTNWAHADFSPLPEDTLIELESVAPREPPANLGIVRIDAEGRFEPGRPTRLSLEVGNWSSQPRTVQVTVEMDDVSCQLEGLCPPNTTATLATELVLPQSGWWHGIARLLQHEDALQADDERHFVIHVCRSPTYALVTRQLSDQPGSSAYYLERALAVGYDQDQQPREQVVRIDSDHLSREGLSKADLILLDHPGKLALDQITLLSSLLRRGRGVIYVVSESVDATNLSALTDAAGSDLQMPVAFVPVPAGQVRQHLFLTDLLEHEPPFSIFGDQLSRALKPLRFAGGLASRQVEGGLSDDLLATLSDRTAFLVVTRCGAGTLAILNADLGLSNFAASPAFVPFMGELVLRALGEGGLPEVLSSGELAACYLPAEVHTVAGLTLAGPESARPSLGELVEENNWVIWRWAAAGVPGAYTVNRKDETVFALATAVPPAEGDLRTLDASILKDRLAGGRPVHFRSNIRVDEKSDDFWIWLAVACVACLCLEILALKVFRT